MLPTARPQSPARVRVGWLPFAGISLPAAEALRLLVMDYERDTSWSLLRICRPPPGAAAGLYTHRTPMSCRRKADLRSTSLPAKLRPGDRSKARQRPRAKRPRGVMDHARNALKRRTVGAARTRFSGGPP